MIRGPSPHNVGLWNGRRERPVGGEMAIVLLASRASAAAVNLFGPGGPPFRALRESMHAAVIPPDSDAPSTEEGAP